jgi:dUTP pyrophosphatase
MSDDLRYTGEGAGPHPPKYPGDCGYDLECSQDVEVPPGQFRDIPTGLRIQLPAGCWGMITGRSSTIRNRKILVVQGIIDGGYRGDVFAAVWNLGGQTAWVKEGERLAQLILFPLITPPTLRVSELGHSSRGTEAFGSTGA